ncbi:MAG: hypothetical protein EOO10_02055 [Chitinophagaceae bacterium]|nr:MAG: hypothetical protein EOO10_02055 [Chitinophagaceae bacterium]
MYPENFQYKLETAIEYFEQQHEEKPSLLKISQQDFKAILPHKEETSHYGLRIKGVMTVGFRDMAKGQYLIIP